MTPKRMKTLAILPAAGLLALGLAACGDAGSSGTTAPEDVEGAGCAPIAGDTLIALEDDKNLQNADNIVAAFNADAADPAAVAALDNVAAELTTEALIELNKAVDIDRMSPSEAAERFVEQYALTDDLEKGSGDFNVGHANFSESQTLATVYQIVLEAAGFDVELTDVGNREVYEPALESGEFDVIPEYAATLAEFLNTAANGGDAEPIASPDIKATMDAARPVAEERGLVLGEASSAANQNAYAVTTAFADEHGVRTLSEFAEKCSGKDTVLGGPPECPDRPFCQPGLEEVYGIQVGQFEPLDIGTLSKQALASGTVTISAVLSTDGSLADGATVNPDETPESD
ncbi:glycine betaine ABC transporter substrate-binding protein [Stackebrandtia soli]|uniref:glycine betaine ABC transporter substrate-binding protein n=1 Tax=Stackebrandtia soli TaxID=1892856 RepID=UPI0039E72D1B